MTLGIARKPLLVLEMIKFEHTIFAMPFALASMLVAANGLPSWRVIGWIVVAMVGARSSAMAFNRIADKKLDTLNPRTAERALPTGAISVVTAWTITILGAALLVFAAYELNPLASALSPLVIIALLGYSYSKRFTSFSHLWLGLCLGIAPVGAWIGVTGRIDFAPMVLSAAVILWTAGFDVIYSLQDEVFDRKMGLFSLPSRFGRGNALLIARFFHTVMVGLLTWFGVLCSLGSAFYVGVGVVAIFLVYEHSLISPEDISRVNAAFFTMNGFVSIAVLGFVALDVLL